MSAPHTQHAISPAEARRRVDADARRSGAPAGWIGALMAVAVLATVVINHLLITITGACK